LRAKLAAKLITIFETNKFDHHKINFVLILLEMLKKIGEHLLNNKLKVLFFKRGVFEDVS
jgi:hypothetical protein